MQIDAPPKPEKTYVTVLASIDQTGLMEPREIIWPDGRKFPIDRVECWRKARDHGPETTYYVIEIGGRKRISTLSFLPRIPGLMDLNNVNIHADRREHQYRVPVPHKPPQQTTAQRSPGRLQHGFLTAVRPGHIDADPLSEPHMLSPFLQRKYLLQVVRAKKRPCFYKDRKKR